MLGYGNCVFLLPTIKIFLSPTILFFYSYQVLSTAAQYQTTSFRALVPWFTWLCRIYMSISKTISLKEAFIQWQIDIPFFLQYKIKKYKKIRTNKFLLFIRKLLRQGFLKKLIFLLYTSYWQLIKVFFTHLLLNTKLFSFLNKHYFYKCWISNSPMINLQEQYVWWDLNYINLYENNFKLSMIIKKLLTLNPIFSFHLEQIDKKVRRYSRNKAHKYTVKYKYVLLYKRVGVLLQWIDKLIKSISTHQFKYKLFVFIYFHLFKYSKSPLFYYKKISNINYFLQNK